MHPADHPHAGTDVIPVPPLPPEAELPAPGRVAWPPDTVRMHLREGDPALRAWAFAWVSRHPEGLTEGDTAAALTSLIDGPDENLRFQAILDAKRYAGHPHARALAAVLAERLPKAREDDTYADVLCALERLDAPRHIEAFREGIESEDDEVLVRALRGVARSGHEDAAGILLGLVQRSSESVVGAEAAAALGELREAGAFEEALRLVIGSSGDATRALVEICDALEGTLSDSLRHQMGSEVYKPGNDAAPALSLLFPAADPAAAARASRVLTPVRRAELTSLMERSRWKELSEAFAAIALEAIDLAVAGDPRRTAWGGVLRSLARCLIEVSRREPVREHARALAIESGTLLACAIRGRDVPKEKAEAGGDPESLMSLLRLDDAWLDDRILASAAAALPEERLMPLLDVSDDFVYENARAVLAVKNPSEHVAPLLRCMCAHEHPDIGLVLDAGGDSVLAPFYERAALHPAGRELLIKAFSAVETERARAMLDRSADVILDGALITRVSKLLLGCGSRSFAEKTFERIRSGYVDLSRLVRSQLVESDVLFDLEQAAALHELPLDPAGVLAEGKESFLRSGRSRKEEGWEDDSGLDGEVPAEGEECFDRSQQHRRDLSPGPHFGGYLEKEHYDEDDPIDPIVRDAPKIGRNDPCPCGSGKKHKKCCGKEA